MSDRKPEHAARTQGEPTDVDGLAARRRTAPNPLRFRVVSREDGHLLRNVIATRLGVSLDDAAELVRRGSVYLRHVRVRFPGARVVSGERVTVWHGPDDGSESDDALAEQGRDKIDPEKLQIVLRDDAFIVLDKPAGVPVAPTKARAWGSLSDTLRSFLEREGVARPYVGVVHRLDQRASGLVLFTTRSAANPSVHAAFVDHSFDRRYLVEVEGELVGDHRCDAWLYELRDGVTVKTAEPGATGAKPAVTHLRAVGYDAALNTTLIMASLETGRGHQIRAHVSALGHPVVHDVRYGAGASAVEHAVPDEDARAMPLQYRRPAAQSHHEAPRRPLHLHAAWMSFEHPIEHRATGRAIVCRANPPAWLAARWPQVDAEQLLDTMAAWRPVSPSSRP